MKTYVTLGFALALAACSPAEKGVFDYTEEEVIGLTTQWVNAAIAGQQFAEDAQCIDQGYEFSEMIKLTQEDLAADTLEIEATKGVSDWRVEFYFDYQKLAGSEPAQTVIFTTPEMFEAGWDQPSTGEYNWCAYAGL